MFKGILGIAALVSMPAAQGCGAPVAECAIDADCDQGQACEASKCVPICGTDADCLEGEDCLNGTTTSLRICQPEMVAANNGALVGTTIALIRDTTQQNCETDAPGSDISFVLLEDSEGNVTAWAEAIANQTEGQANAYASADHIDGSRPEAGADSCPADLDGAVVSLGCGGHLAVSFLDEDGQTVSLRTGEHRIRVGERGAQCEETEPDTYAVLLCPGAMSVEEIPRACSVELGVGSAERVFDL